MKRTVEIEDVLIYLGRCPACGAGMHQGSSNPSGACTKCPAGIRDACVGLLAVIVELLDCEGADPRPLLTDAVNAMPSALVVAARERVDAARLANVV